MKTIPKLLPSELSSLLAILMGYILPFCDYLTLMVYKMPPHPLLFTDFHHEALTDRWLTHATLAMTARHFASGLTPAQLRQMFVAITRAHSIGDESHPELCVDLAAQEQDPTFDCIPDLAAGHSTRTANLHYGLSLDINDLAFLNSETIDAFR